MRTLLCALVAVGFMVGCGGDTAKTSTEKKASTTVTTPSGTTKVETTKKDETKVSTDKPKTP